MQTPMRHVPYRLLLTHSHPSSPPVVHLRLQCFTYHRRSGMKAPTDADPDAARALGELVASPLPIPLPRSLPPLPLRTNVGGRRGEGQGGAPEGLMGGRGGAGGGSKG